MTKRTTGQYPRRDRDFYATPEEPILKLLPHLYACSKFAEPMCGDGAIVRVLEARGWTCGAAWDLEPQGEMIERAGTYDVMGLEANDFADCDHVISNPPWPARFQRGNPTTSIAMHLSDILPTWLLLSADFMHNVYAAPLLKRCPKIVSVGRVKWIEGSDHSGLDNAAWYLFDGRKKVKAPLLYGHKEPVRLFHPDIEDVL